jgi:hypothetical protein
MLKKIALVTLFVVSAAVAVSSTVSAQAAKKAPLPTAPQGMCFPPGGKC